MHKRYWIPIVVFFAYVFVTLYLGFQVRDDYLIDLNPLLSICVEGCGAPTIVAGTVFTGLIVSVLSWFLVRKIASKF